MRNLKRTLSLALAAVMLMGMMVVGAGAASKDFTDAGEIKNVEAVDVMVALGILEGGDKGDFQPNSILTREQAAKIICYLLLGTESAEKLTTNSTVFNDVAADRWSAPYIGYCVNLGILAGDGQGNFFPEGKLTGAAFAKMLLVALGYDPKIENYTGNSWTINVAADTIEAGISPKGVVLSNELSRQDAAQMAFQTLTADMVKYASKGTTVIGSDGMQVIVGNTPAESVKDGSENYTDGDNDGIQQFCEKYFTDLKKVSGETDAFGRPGYTWQYNKEDVTFAADEADYTIVVSKADKDAEYWATEANKKLDIDDATTVKNGFAGDAYEIGDVVEYYVGDNNEVSKIIVTRYTADVITDVDTDVKKDDAEDGVTAYITFDKAGTFNNTDVAGYNADTYVEDAVVALVEGTGDYKDEIIGSYVAETVEGAITAYTATTYTIDGTKYTMTKSADDEIAQKVDFKEGSYKLYLDNNGYVIKAEVVEGSITIDDVFYLDNIAKIGGTDRPYWVETETVKGKTTNSYYVQAVYLDGTVEDIMVAEAEKSTAKDTAVVTYLNGLTVGFYTKDAYTVKYDTDKTYDVTLKVWKDSDFKVSSDLADGNLEITADTKKLNGAYLDKNTQYVVIESYNDDVKVTTKTGSISYEDEANDVVLVISKTVNGSPVVQYVVIISDSFTAAATGDYFYVDDASATTVSGGKQYTVYSKTGEETTIVVDKDSTVKTLSAGKFYEYAEMTNGNYDVKGELDADVMDTTTFVSYYGDSLTVAGNKNVVDTADAAIVDTHDTDGDYSKSITTLAGMQTAQKAGYNVYLKVVYADSKKEAAQLIVVYNVADTATVDKVNDSVDAIGDTNGKFEVDGSDVTVTGDKSYIESTNPGDDGAPMKISADLAKFLGALKRTGEAAKIEYQGKTYTWITTGTGVTELKGSNWRTGNDTDGYTTLVKAVTDDWKNGGDWKTGVTYTATLTVDGVDMTYTAVVG